MIGFHYQRSEPAAAADDFCGHLRSIGQAIDTAASRRWSASSSTARTAGSTIPAAAWRSCGPSTSAARTTPGIQPGDARRATWRSIRRAIRCRTCSPAAGSTTTSPSGSATRRTTPPGTPCTAPASICAARPGRATVAEAAIGAGLGGNLHRRGQRLVLVVRRRSLQRPGRAVRLPVPQAPAERLPAAGRRAAAGTGPADQPRAASGPCTPCRGRSWTSRSTAGETFFEWISAGHYTCQNERGTMAMATRGPIKDVYFGFDLQGAADPRRFRGPGPGGPGRLRCPAHRLRASRPAGSCWSTKPGRRRTA